MDYRTEIVLQDFPFLIENRCGRWIFDNNISYPKEETKKSRGKAFGYPR